MGGQPASSALQTLLSTTTTEGASHPEHLQNLTLQVQHNLQHQHNWTELTIHTHSPLPLSSSPSTPSPSSRKRKRTLLPRPLISGLPPQRLYVHPDEQIELLQKARKEATAAAARKDQSATVTAKAGAHAGTEGQGDVGEKEKDGDGDGKNGVLTGMGEVKPEREWVCPSHIREKWSLRRFGDVFEQIGEVPPVPTSTVSSSFPFPTDHDDDDDDEDENEEQDQEQKNRNPWRTTKRILLATVDTDSTIVYYIVHDGIVKPRQN